MVLIDLVHAQRQEPRGPSPDIRALQGPEGPCYRAKSSHSSLAHGMSRCRQCLEDQCSTPMLPMETDMHHVS